MPDRRDEIMAREAKATKGPWTASSRHAMNTGDEDEASGLGWDVEGPPEPQLRGQFSKAGDAKFIAHSRSDIPYLGWRLEAAEAVITLYAAWDVGGPTVDQLEALVDARLSWEKAKESNE